MASDDPASHDDEMNVMIQARKLVSGLESPAQRRVLLWLADVFSVGLENTAQGTRPGGASGPTDAPPLKAGAAQGNLPVSFAGLLERTEPANNADRVLVAGYWLQEVEGGETLDGRTINKLLKEHGIDVSNVTNAFTTLINRRPRLAMQAGKKGKFEKLYRLTTEGRKQVSAIISERE